MAVLIKNLAVVSLRLHILFFRLVRKLGIFRGERIRLCKVAQHLRAEQPSSEPKVQDFGERRLDLLRDRS